MGMRQRDPDIDLLLALSHLYHVTINEMLEDADLLLKLTGVASRPSGIAYFVPEQERDYNLAWANAVREERWVERNWQNACAPNPHRDKTGAEIAALRWNHPGNWRRPGRRQPCPISSKQTQTPRLW